MSELKREWFEPGPDGESPFEREYYNHRGSGTIAGNAISAAFRALLAGEEATEPPALRVGDVVRLEDVPDATWMKHNLSVIGHIGKIYRIDSYNGEEIRAAIEPDYYWPVSALTLVRRAGEAVPVDKDAKDAEIAELRAEVERWKSIADALRARIAAGVRVCRFPSMKKSWSENLSSFPESCERGIILIDARPIDQPDHIADPGKMVDERTPGTIADRKGKS